MTTIDTKHCGQLQFHIEGVRSNNEVAILTVHDIGCNHNQFKNFLKDPAMSSLAPRCVWFNVDLPGQGSDDKDLPTNFNYPTLSDIAEDLLDCISQLNISHLILFGEGAGANILARMLVTGDERILGAVLLNCVGHSPGFISTLKEKIINWKLSSIGMTHSTENYLVAHRFGVMNKSKTDAELCSMIDDYKTFVRQTINAKNLHGYVNSYMQRSVLLDKLAQIKCPVLFVTGTLANSFGAVKNLYEDVVAHLKAEPERKRLIELMEVDDCANVLVEKPERVAESVQYFLQGIGLVSSAPSRRMSNTVRPAGIGRRISMEEYDSPVGVVNLTYNPTRKYSSGGPIGDQ